MIRAICKFETPGKRAEFEAWDFPGMPSADQIISWPVRGDWRITRISWRQVSAGKPLALHVTLERVQL